MPYDDPDITDPMTLHGVMFETGDAGAMREMAACFVEEYARMGFGPDRILKLFKTRGYAGPYLAYHVLGDSVIRALIDECVQAWGPRSPAPRLERHATGDLGLPVLEL